MNAGNDNPEKARLEAARRQGVAWKKWGPYLSERQWGTVREDYSENGDAWNYFTHDQARSRAYRWGEDGIAGISDDRQRLCFALAVWNGKDPILKERLFGLTNSEGNHGEDVKEYYFYLDSTPTHSYMKYLYKYPQAAFPYADLVEKNKRRSRDEMEYELLDTGAFDDNRYFDVFVEYAKAAPEDVLIRISVCNRGPEAAALQVLPTLWFRNNWSWGGGPARPSPRAVPDAGSAVVHGHRGDPQFPPSLPDYFFFCEGAASLLFAENETNHARLFGGNSNWRGPVWLPVNFLLYTALLRLYAYYGEDFKVECPTGSGRMMTLLEVAKEIGERLTRTFLRDGAGRRPVYGDAGKLQEDPHWRDPILFYEYFHGDTGAGVGASHQTGWTGVVARIIQGNALLTPGFEGAVVSRAAGAGAE